MRNFLTKHADFVTNLSEFLTKHVEFSDKNCGISEAHILVAMCGSRSHPGRGPSHSVRGSCRPPARRSRDHRSPPACRITSSGTWKHGNQDTHDFPLLVRKHSDTRK